MAGYLAAAKQLLASENPASGFTELWLCGRLDISVEAKVLQPEFTSLFTEEERSIARQRLAQYNYEMD